MPKENQKLEVKISEDELRELIHGEEYRWVIKTDKGEDINVLVRLERFDDLEMDEEETEEEDDEDETEEDEEVEEDSEF
jgi:hypothetical protein